MVIPRTILIGDGMRANTSRHSQHCNLSSRLATDNEIQKALDIALPFIDRLKKHPEVVGVILLGGLGQRQWIDRFSDIDIAVVTESPFSALPPFSFHVHSEGRRYEYNLSQLDLDSEIKSEWSPDKRQAYSTGSVVYDPEGKVSALLQQKLVRNVKNDFENIVSLINQYRWRVQYHANAAMERGLPETAHQLLNQGVELIGETLFLAHAQDKPHTKWSFLQLESISEVGWECAQLLKKALVVRGMDFPAFSDRLEILNQAFASTLHFVRDRFPDLPDDCYRYWASHLSLRQLISTPFAHQLSDLLFDQFNSSEISMIEGLVSYHLLGTPEELVRMLRSDKDSGLPSLLKDKLLGILAPVEQMGRSLGESANVGGGA